MNVFSNACLRVVKKVIQLNILREQRLCVQQATRSEVETIGAVVPNGT
jgi:hypothetical protein